VQVHDEGNVGVGAGVKGAIVIIILGDHNSLGIGELLFQVMSDGIFCFPSEGSGALTHPCLVQSLVCGSHSGNESLLL
jgi:hypothetical protein